MSTKELIKGLEFVLKYNLSQREIYVLLKLMKGHYTANELAKELSMSYKSTHALIQRLNIRGLLLSVKKEDNKTHLHTFDNKILEN